jgi:hypothetical protein
VSWDVTIVTHGGAPDGAADDVCLADAFRDAGASPRFAVWNDPTIDWAASALTVIRSTWDYHLAPAAWQCWVDEVARVTRIANAPELLRWNTDKGYLLELAGRGVGGGPPAPGRKGNAAPVRTVTEAQALFGSLWDRGWDDIVVKPAVGASAHGAKRFHGPDHAAGQAHALELLRRGAALVQPFQAGVLEGRERSLVMIGGRFSHAFSKPAFYAGAAFGGFDVVRHEPTHAELLAADSAILALSEGPSYARVDMVPTADGPLLMELELIEPHLALMDNPASATLLAKELLRESSPWSYPLIRDRP